MPAPSSHSFPSDGSAVTVDALRAEVHKLVGDNVELPEDLESAIGEMYVSSLCVHLLLGPDCIQCPGTDRGLAEYGGLPRRDGRAGGDQDDHETVRAREWLLRHRHGRHVDGHRGWAVRLIHK